MSKWFAILVLFTTHAWAAAPTWQIVPDKSTLSFSATQNNAPVSGHFKKFWGEIIFAPDDLANSRVKITVDMSSVSTEYEDLDVTLKTPEWFNIEKFPNAVFESTAIKKGQDNHYTAEGKLTIRDKSTAVTLNFDLNKYDLSEAHVSGKVDLKRLDFSVGTGEWSSTDEVNNEVSVNFTIIATPISLKN